jgi:steroid delta-isomerase-like uncharacterized protein
MSSNPTVTAGPKTSPVDTVKRAIDAFNRHDAAGYAATYTEEAVVVDPAYPKPLHGREEIRQDIAAFFGAFPDIQATLGRQLADGDIIALEVSMNATHTGVLPTPQGEIPPTGQRVNIEVAAFLTFDARGLVSQSRRYYDMAGLANQLAR